MHCFNIFTYWTVPTSFIIPSSFLQARLWCLESSPKEALPQRWCFATICICHHQQCNNSIFVNPVFVNFSSLPTLCHRHLCSSSRLLAQCLYFCICPLERQACIVQLWFPVSIPCLLVMFGILVFPIQCHFQAPRLIQKPFFVHFYSHALWWNI